MKKSLPFPTDQPPQSEEGLPSPGGSAPPLGPCLLHLVDYVPLSEYMPRKHLADHLGKGVTELPMVAAIGFHWCWPTQKTSPAALKRPSGFMVAEADPQVLRPGPSMGFRDLITSAFEWNMERK